MVGIGVSPGISIGKACILKKNAAVCSGIALENEGAKQAEIIKFDLAVLAAIDEVEAIKANKSLTLNQSDIEILETQIEFLADPQIKTDVYDKINLENKTANDAVIEVIIEAVKMFKNLDDEYLSARAADIQDIGNRIINNLN